MSRATRHVFLPLNIKSHNSSVAPYAKKIIFHIYVFTEPTKSDDPNKGNRKISGRINSFDVETLKKYLGQLSFPGQKVEFTYTKKSLNDEKAAQQAFDKSLKQSTPATEKVAGFS